MASSLITKKLVDGAKPADRDVFIWDRDVSGFGLKVTPRGRKTYVLQYRLGGRGTATKRITIGRHGSPWTPELARREAKSLLELVKRGTDPMAAKRDRLRLSCENPFCQYLTHFLAVYGKRHWRPRTYASAESNLRRYVSPLLKNKSLLSITRTDLVAVFDALPKESAALPRSVYAHTRKLFTWALERGDIQRSPFEGMKSPPQGSSRDRVLTDAEIGLIWLASHDIEPTYGTFVRLLMLTGQRRDEVAGIRWEELNRSEETWTLPGNRTKNGLLSVVPLPEEAVRELDGITKGRWPTVGYVFPTRGKSYISSFSSVKRQLDIAMGNKLSRREADLRISPWRFHDLRRTFATGMQKLGIRFEVTEALLNHVSGSRSGVVGVYQRHEWSEEKREAIKKWASRICQSSQAVKAQLKL